MSVLKELLIVNEADKVEVRKHYNITPEQIEQDVEILLDWLNKQPHLPAPHDKNRLERFLLRNKFRIERTKLKHDNYYSCRGLHPDIFREYNPDSPAIKSVRESIIYVPMPKLLPTKERLAIYAINGNSIVDYEFKNCITYCFMAMDLQISHDYAVSDRYVCDLSNMALKDTVKIYPNVLAKAMELHQAYSARTSYIEYLYMPPVFHLFMNLIKNVMPPKLFKKVRKHKDLDSLYKVLPKEYLPREYGGDQPSVYDLHEKWGKELTLKKDFLKTIAQQASNEKLRIGETTHNTLFGIDGTFRKINLD